MAYAIVEYMPAAFSLLAYIHLMYCSANMLRMLKTSENPNKMLTQIQYQCHSVNGDVQYPQRSHGWRLSGQVYKLEEYLTKEGKGTSNSPGPNDKPTINADAIIFTTDVVIDALFRLLEL
uniref:Uncharacterized protein n=1 Tax=Oryza glumipatula TaxID=40148 RepID=A0A0E0AYF7_9ORYZ